MVHSHQQLDSWQRCPVLVFIYLFVIFVRTVGLPLDAALTTILFALQMSNQGAFLLLSPLPLAPPFPGVTLIPLRSPTSPQPLVEQQQQKPAAMLIP